MISHTPASAGRRARQVNHNLGVAGPRGTPPGWAHSGRCARAGRILGHRREAASADRCTIVGGDTRGRAETVVDGDSECRGTLVVKFFSAVISTRSGFPSARLGCRWYADHGCDPSAVACSCPPIMIASFSRSSSSTCDHAATRIGDDLSMGQRHGRPGAGLNWRPAA